MEDVVRWSCFVVVEIIMMNIREFVRSSIWKISGCYEFWSCSCIGGNVGFCRPAHEISINRMCMKNYVYEKLCEDELDLDLTNSM